MSSSKKTNASRRRSTTFGLCLIKNRPSGRPSGMAMRRGPASPLLKRNFQQPSLVAGFHQVVKATVPRCIAKRSFKDAVTNDAVAALGGVCFPEGKGGEGASSVLEI
jgi:hypothetical protein